MRRRRSPLDIPRSMDTGSDTSSRRYSAPASAASADEPLPADVFGEHMPGLPRRSGSRARASDARTAGARSEGGVEAALEALDIGLGVAAQVEPRLTWSHRFADPAAEAAYLVHWAREWPYAVLLAGIVGAVYTCAFAVATPYWPWLGVALLFAGAAAIDAVVVQWRPAALYALPWLARLPPPEADLLAARVHEAVAVAVLVAVALLAAADYDAMRSMCTAAPPAAAQQTLAEWCYRRVMAPYGGGVLFIVRPRLCFAAPVAALQLVATAALGLGLFDADTDAVLLAQAVHAALLVAAVVALGGHERVTRARYGIAAAHARARAAVEQRRAAVDALVEAAVPALAWARLRGAASVTDIRMEDHTPTAAVGAADVVDFAHWTTGLLPIDVVHVLHRLFTMYDDACPTFGVAKAATYADSYTVVAGLRRSASIATESPADSTGSTVAAAVTGCLTCLGAAALGAQGVGAKGVAKAAVGSAVAFGRWQVGQAVSSLLAGCPAPPGIRAAVAVGPVAGGVAGRLSSVRYVVVGETVAVARRLLAQAPAGQVLVSDYAQALLDDTAADSGSSPATSPPTSPLGQGKAPGTVHTARTEASCGAEPPPLQPWSLTFADPAVEAAAEASVAAHDAVLCGTAAAVPATLFAAGAATLIVERLAVGRTPLRPIDAAPAACLGAASALQGIRIARFRWGRPVGDHAVAAVSLLLGAVGFYFGDDAVALTTPAYAVYALGLLPHAYGQTTYWPVTLACQVVAMAALAAAYLARTETAFELFIVAALAGCIAIAVPLVYLGRRALRSAFGRAYAAQRLAGAAAEAAALQAQLLQGLLPPHVAAAELRQRLAYGPPPDGDYHPHRLQQWTTLVVVAGRANARGVGTQPGAQPGPHQSPLHSPASAPVAPAIGCVQQTARLWGALAAAVAQQPASGLELLTTDGDAFCAAGSFGSASDAAQHSAAAGAVAVLRAVAQGRRPQRGFTAAVAAGPAFSALLGAQRITYRLLGPGVREAEALLAGAPTPLEPALSHAFAAPSFRRILDPEPMVTAGALAPLPVAGRQASLHLSVALPPQELRRARGYGSDAAGAPRDGGRSEESQATDATVASLSSVGPHPHPRSLFGPPLRWRVRGAGVVMVSTVRLPPGPGAGSADGGGPVLPGQVVSPP